MNIIQRIGKAIKSFVGKRVTGSTTKSRINRALRNYSKVQTTRKESLNMVKDANSLAYRNKLSQDIGKQIDVVDKIIGKGRIKHLRTLTEKELKLFENVFNVEVSESPAVENLKTFDEMSSFKQMIIETLRKNGVDVFNPRELYEALDGHTPEEIYDTWKANEYENEDFYEEWVEDPEDVLDKLFTTGVDESITNYKDKQTKMWEDMKDFF